MEQTSSIWPAEYMRARIKRICGENVECGVDWGRLLLGGLLSLKSRSSARARRVTLVRPKSAVHADHESVHEQQKERPIIPAICSKTTLHSLEGILNMSMGVGSGLSAEAWKGRHEMVHTHCGRNVHLLE